MADSIKQLIQTRGQIKAHLTRFKTFLDHFDREQSIVAIETRLQRFEPLFEQFDTVQSKIENALQDEVHEIEACQNERNQFDTSYFDLLTRARILIQLGRDATREQRAIRQEDGQDNEMQLGIKLPVIKLLTFDGLPERWIKFRDTFQSMIDDNQRLSNIQKFHYLESAIMGEASRAIEALGISAANYTTAWAILKERFEDTKALSHFHIKGLFELLTMTKDSPVSLRQLIDQANNHLLALQNLATKQ